MNNLFVVHTQYNLILACGLAKTIFKEDYNQVIIFKDFREAEKLEEKLKEVFASVLFLTGNVPPRNEGSIQRLRYLREMNKKIRHAMRKSFDRIFIVDDMCVPEMYALKYAAKRNPKVEMVWLEDGANAYFSNGVISSGMGGTPIKRWIRKLFFGGVWRLGKYYDLGPCMGTHKFLKKAYMTFPACARKEFADRECILIDDNAFRQGLDTMYGGKSLSFEENSLLLVLDKLDVYGDDLDKISKVLQKHVEQAKMQGQTVYYKYHPRETARLSWLAKEKELDRSIALESYLAASTTMRITAIGIKSTALQTVKKMGYEVKSLIGFFEKDDSPIIVFYKNIGIEVL